MDQVTEMRESLCDSLFATDPLLLVGGSEKLPQQRGDVSARFLHPQRKRRRDERTRDRETENKAKGCIVLFFSFLFTGHSLNTRKIRTRRTMTRKMTRYQPHLSGNGEKKKGEKGLP